MRPVTETPTKPIDYATLSATYGALLGTVVLAARRAHADAARGSAGSEPVRAGELAPLGLAAFALSKMVAKEKVETWVRAPFVDEPSRRPKGSRLRYAIGELLTCTRCLGAWSSLGLVALRVTRPREARVVTTVLATSALNDWLQSAFSLMCSQADDAGARRDERVQKLRAG
jgi:hypothetical protein